MVRYTQNYSSYQPSSRPPSSKPPHDKRSARSQIIVTALLAVVVFGIAYGLDRFNPVTAKQVAANAPAASPTTPAAAPIANPAALANSINDVISKNSTVQIGVALESISTGETQTYGITAPFEAASTAKVLTAANYYHLVETGQASLSTMLGDYTAAYQIKQMINQSNNDSWSLLTGAIGDDELAAYASANGITYDVAGNLLSPSAMATLLRKLYNGQLLNKTDTAQLLSYMQDTNDEELIPSVVPNDITIYHKYGELQDELHDAAILIKGNDAYCLVIYTKSASSNGDDSQADIIHQIATAVTSQVFE